MSKKQIIAKCTIKYEGDKDFSTPTENPMILQAGDLLELGNDTDDNWWSAWKIKVDVNPAYENGYQIKRAPITQIIPSLQRMIEMQFRSQRKLEFIDVSNRKPETIQYFREEAYKTIMSDIQTEWNVSKQIMLNTSNSNKAKKAARDRIDNLGKYMEENHLQLRYQENMAANKNGDKSTLVSGRKILPGALNVKVENDDKLARSSIRSGSFSGAIEYRPLVHVNVINVPLRIISKY